MIAFNNKVSNEEKKRRTEELDKIAYERFKNGESITRIAKDFKMNRCRLSNRLQEKFGITPCLDGGKIQVDSHYFNVLNRDNAYWLGIILADGNISKDFKRLELTLKDKEHIERFKNDLKSEHKIHTREINGTSYYRLSFNDRNIVNDLYNLGILPNKSNIDFHLPYVPDELFNDFLRGIIDGDGMIYASKSTNEKTGKTRFFFHIYISIGFHCKSYATELKDRIDKTYGVNGKLYKQRTCYSLQYFNKDTVKITDQIYKDTDLYLQRKYSKLLKYKEFCKNKNKGGDAK